MSEPWLLSEAQMRRIEPYFPLSHGIPRVDDRRIVSGIIYVIRGGLVGAHRQNALRVAHAHAHDRHTALGKTMVEERR